MTIYIDLVFVLNWFFDFNLLLTVNNTLKRNVSLKRIIFGSFVGSLSIFVLFISISSFLLFLIKLLLGVLMCLITFGKKDKKYVCQNVSYLYMTSIVLGGFLYFFNLSFRESHYELLFTYDSMSFNFLFFVIFSPVMLYVYIRQRRDVSYYTQVYPVEITFLNGQKLTLNAYLDTGNQLVDPLTHKKVILVNSKVIPPPWIENIYYVPYHSLNHHGMVKCFKIDSLRIGEKQSSNYLIGLSEEKLIGDGVECVLNYACMEELL